LTSIIYRRGIHSVVPSEQFKNFNKTFGYRTMKTSKLTALAAAVAAALLLNASSVSAQDPTPAPDAAASPAAAATPATPPPAAPQAPANNRGRGQFQQRMNDMLKTMLKASDDEWSVIQPLLEKVQTQAMAGRPQFGGGRRGGGPGGPGGANGGPGGANGGPGGPALRASGLPDFGRTPETTDLQTALEADGTPAETIKAKLDAVRDARKKAAAELDQARQELAKVLTQRQEALLVLAGVLE
jgi:hypothetical protein